MTLADNKDGTYRANFSPSKSGRYRLDLNMITKRNAAIRVQGSPLEVTLIMNQQGLSSLFFFFSFSFALFGADSFLQMFKSILNIPLSIKTCYVANA